MGNPPFRKVQSLDLGFGKTADSEGASSIFDVSKWKKGDPPALRPSNRSCREGREGRVRESGSAPRLGVRLIIMANQELVAALTQSQSHLPVRPFPTLSASRPLSLSLSRARARCERALTSFSLFRFSADLRDLGRIRDPGRRRRRFSRQRAETPGTLPRSSMFCWRRASTSLCSRPPRSPSRTTSSTTG